MTAFQVVIFFIFFSQIKFDKKRQKGILKPVIETNLSGVEKW